jgi:hypothetical protein
MRLHRLFLTAKTAALYLVPFKSYSRNTHDSSILKWTLVRFVCMTKQSIAILLSVSELKRTEHQTNISSILVVSDLRFSPVERGDTGMSLSQPQIASYYRS